MIQRFAEHAGRKIGTLFEVQRERAGPHVDGGSGRVRQFGLLEEVCEVCERGKEDQSEALSEGADDRQARPLDPIGGDIHA